MKVARTVVACSLALAVSSAVPASATEPSAPLLEARARLVQVDGDLASATGQLEAWQVRLDAWSRRLETAGRALVLVEREARSAGPAPVVVDSLHLGSARPTLLQFRVAQARHRLAELREDDGASRALRRVFQMQSTIAGLEAQRSSMEAEVALFARPEWNDPAAAEPNAGTWARLFLTTIGAPTCGDNVIVMLAWQAQESTTARFNPLATTHDEPGATQFNPIGVRNYTTVAQGLEAARATLELPVTAYGYAPILTSLRACSAAETTAWYINASAWCRGCTGGAYITALIPIVRANPSTYEVRT